LASTEDSPSFARGAGASWAARFALDREVVERAVARGELPEGTDPAFVIESVLGPIYFRLLISGEPLDVAFAERVGDFVIAGVRANAHASGGDRPDGRRGRSR
jgi:hypothetical protein